MNTHTDTSSIYQLQFEGIDNNIIDMSSYINEQIIVFEFDAANPDRQQIIALDSLYKNSNNLVIIAVPVKDFDSTAISNDSLRIILKDSLQVSYPVTGISLAQKDSPGQHPLLNWVTHLESNNHFNDDINDAGYMFVISKTGILYSIMEKEISPSGATMQEIIINQPLE